MTVKIYKCFIASPSDNQAERNECDNVFQKINSTLGEQLNFRIEPKKWEDHSRPSFGDDGQTVINDQLLSNYDLFIGIMWSRFGASTKRAESGTEEEFNHAYTKYINEENIEIMFYFNEQELKPSDIDPEQLGKVQKFKNKISELGGLYSKFNGTQDFSEKLYKHLYGYFVQKLSSNSSSPEIKVESEKLKQIALKEAVSLVLSQRLNDALVMYSNQPIFWIDPILMESQEISQNPDDNYSTRIDIDSIVENPNSIIVQAPPQFGLTCLGHYLIKKAWEKDHLWVYLDAEKLKKGTIQKCVQNEKKNLNIEAVEIKCIILDSFCSTEPGANKLLKNLCNEFKSIPIIVMQTIDESKFKAQNKEENIGRSFKVLHLLALPRTQMRAVISEYNKVIPIGEENSVLNKLVSDFSVLNIHRTVSNCLTLLKVSEKHFDESPVNRTKMLEMVLFVLFDLGNIPSYKSKPDVKDCEYVLGIFCDNLIRNVKYNFTRDIFISEIKKYCEEKLIELEVTLVFDILFANNIIVKREDGFAFRATYWIYYFAAKRMHTNEPFRDYILKEKRYSSFPEIIEFYTGIDRNRTDALDFLRKDLAETCKLVNDKVGIPGDLNPLKNATWKPTSDSLQKMKEEINEDVQNSKLPDSVKDQFEDRTYNQLKPYNQSITTILEEYSVAMLMQKIKASSRALRNSDYSDPISKKALLEEIIQGWEQISKVLFALAPALATQGRASIEGQEFILADDFGSTFEERLQMVILSNPTNVVGFFKDDIISDKIGPLIFDRLRNENDDLKRHQLILLIIFSRPRGWKEVVENYISKIPKNSFYLYGTVSALKTKYKYAFVDSSELSKMAYLIKMGIAKHEFGENKPSIGLMNRISNSVLPKRELDGEDE